MAPRSYLDKSAALKRLDGIHLRSQAVRDLQGKVEKQGEVLEQLKPLPQNDDMDIDDVTAHIKGSTRVGEVLDRGDTVLEKSKHQLQQINQKLDQYLKVSEDPSIDTENAKEVVQAKRIACLEFLHKTRKVSGVGEDRFKEVELRVQYLPAVIKPGEVYTLEQIVWAMGPDAQAKDSWTAEEVMDALFKAREDLESLPKSHTKLDEIASTTSRIEQDLKSLSSNISATHAAETLQTGEKRKRLTVDTSLANRASGQAQAPATPALKSPRLSFPATSPNVPSPLSHTGSMPTPTLPSPALPSSSLAGGQQRSSSLSSLNPPGQQPNVESILQRFVAWNGLEDDDTERDYIPATQLPATILDVVRTQLQGSVWSRMKAEKVDEAIERNARSSKACMYTRANRHLPDATSDENESCGHCIREPRICILKQKDEKGAAPSPPVIVPLPKKQRQDLQIDDLKFWMKQ